MISKLVVSIFYRVMISLGNQREAKREQSGLEFAYHFKGELNSRPLAGVILDQSHRMLSFPVPTPPTKSKGVYPFSLWNPTSDFTTTNTCMHSGGCTSCSSGGEATFYHLYPFGFSFIKHPLQCCVAPKTFCLGLLLGGLILRFVYSFILLQQNNPFLKFFSVFFWR